MRARAAALAAAALATAAPAFADHGVGLRSEGWSPLVTALVFGALAFVAGLVVVVIVALLTRRDERPDPD